VVEAAAVEAAAGEAPSWEMNVVTHFEKVPAMKHDWNWMRGLGAGTSGEMCPDCSASEATATVTKAFRQQGVCNDHELEQIQLQALYMVNSNQPGRSKRRCKVNQ